MKPLISIIIPTCNDYQKLLKPCLDSIEKYTDLSRVEVIVINNAIPNEEKIFFASLPEYVKLISYPQPIGFPKAVNKGIEIAEGEYLILLNNDCVLLEQIKNDWINKLLLPFFTDETVGITGVFKKSIPEINRSFLLFFCAMIKKEVFEKVGMLDESMGRGYCEDMAMSLKVEDVGYKVVQVPDEKEGEFDGKQYLTDFPLYHRARATFDNISDEADKSYAENFKKILAKYA